MRTLGEIVGFLLILGGVLCTFAGCVVWTMNPERGIIFWLGLALIAFGWILNNTAATKTCPWCSERVKYRALKCKHCGAALAN